MTPFVPGLLVGYALGIASMCGLVGLYLLHRPRYVAPTKHHRQWRDKPIAETPPPWEREEKPAEPIYMYGVTGEER
jgi:hypothetical protein